MGPFSKADLRTLHASLARLLPPASPLRTAAEVVEVQRVLEVVARAIRERAPALERGALVLSWRVPREHALTLNQYAQAKGWQKKKLRTALDDSLRAILPSFPGALAYGPARRWLRLTRFSTQRVDELSVDILGGKMPVDALKRCGVIVDDDAAHVHREPRWEKTKPGNAHVLIEVFEMSTEGAVADAAKDALVVQATRTDGAFTRSLKEG